MKTTVMFINQTQPLAGVKVRLAGDDDSRTVATNSEGKVEFNLIPGNYTFEIEFEERWIRREVARQGDADLFVVDISRGDADIMSGLNTLQLNLASLVGDRYVFEAVLGRGGMGVVVKAVDRLLNRPVAMKMLSEELQDNEEAQQIFLLEARNLATLSHQNLVAIHDVLNIDGHVLMIFEYVYGENLEDRIQRQGKLGQIEALRMSIQLMRCVSYLHEHELIHRDLKPANIIMQADGTLKLIDFGLARSLNELYIRGTRVRGTPAYMAPEQVMGVHLTVQTDIYQLGISLFEALAGQLPFPTGDMSYAHVHREPPQLSSFVPKVDPELAELIHQCLMKEPRKRPESAAVMLEKLSSIYTRLVTTEGIANELMDVSGSFASVGDHFSELDVSEVSEAIDDDEALVPPVEDAPVATAAVPAPAAAKSVASPEEKGRSNFGIYAIGALLVVISSLALFAVMKEAGKEVEVEASVGTVGARVDIEPASAVESEAEPDEKGMVAEPEPADDIVFDESIDAGLIDVEEPVEVVDVAAPVEAAPVVKEAPVAKPVVARPPTKRRPAVSKSEKSTSTKEEDLTVDLIKIEGAPAQKKKVTGELLPVE